MTITQPAIVQKKIFFPDKSQTATAAKKVCAVCPVRAACLTDAVANREKYGCAAG